MNLQTLRYYERRGLLEEPDRTLGGYRVYSEEAVTLLRVIKTAQRLGSTLAQAADLLETGTAFVLFAVSRLAFLATGCPCARRVPGPDW